MDPGDFLIEEWAELAREPVEPETRRAVFDPEIPPADLRRLRRRVDRLIAASLAPRPARKVPLVAPRQRFDRILAMGIGLATVGLMAGIKASLAEEPLRAGPMMKDRVIGLTFGVVMATLLIGVWAVVVMIRETIPADRAVRVHHGRYLLPDEDLDSSASELYKRAERALDQVKAASITKDGLLKPELTTADTDRWKWQIARQLRELTTRRTGQDQPEAQLRKAPSELEATITGRLVTLERLAGVVIEGEATIRKERTSGTLSQYQLLRIRALAAQVRDEFTPPDSRPA